MFASVSRLFSHLVLVAAGDSLGEGRGEQSSEKGSQCCWSQGNSDDIATRPELPEQ